MKTENIDELLNRYHAGESSPDQERVLKAWLHTFRSEGSTGLTDDDFEQARLNMLAGIRAATQKGAGKYRLWQRFAAAVAAVALIVWGIYLFNYRQTGSVNYAGLSEEDINPGKVGATLTLANGKKIRLGDALNGELAREAGVSVKKTAEGQLVYEIKQFGGQPGKINTLSTANGETYSITLPDKSKVWLNAASSLTYSTALNERGIRRVKLQGEAFFEVAKDKAHPFVVQAANQEVEVLGTQFNINSYSDEPVVATTLVEGAVKVRSGNRQQLMAPGEQLTNDGTALRIKKINPEDVMDWKNGDFNLDSLPFRLAMRKIARWYNLDVDYDQSVSDNMIAGGWISRQAKLSTILEGIQRAGQVRFKLEGRKLYVSK